MPDVFLPCLNKGDDDVEEGGGELRGLTYVDEFAPGC